MAFKCQKWRLDFSKFHKTILAFKTPKWDVVVINIGVLNSKNKAFKTPKKKRFKHPYFAILNAKISVLNAKIGEFYEMDPWSKP